MKTLDRLIQALIDLDIDLQTEVANRRRIAEEMDSRGNTIAHIANHQYADGLDTARKMLIERLSKVVPDVS